MPVIPNRMLVLLALVPLAVSVFALLDTSLIVPMLMIDAAIVLVALMDALLCIKPLVTVRRRHPNVFSIGRNNAVELEVRSTAARRLPVQVTIDLFDRAESDQLPAQVRVPRRGKETTKVRVVPARRGAYELGNAYARYPSPLGLWTRQVRIEGRSQVRVYPDVQAVRTYELLARQDRQHSMMRTTRKLGGESEFEQLRDYTRDDEFRSIDWKATARRDQLTARQYQLESNQNVMFMLDAGRLMTAESHGIPLFDHALNATLMLSHVASSGGDRVGLLAFGAEVERLVPPEGGRKAVQRIIQASYTLHPALEEPDFNAAFQVLNLRVRKRTLLVMFTQLQDAQTAAELVRLTRSVMRRHLPLVVLFRDTQVEALVRQDTGLPADLYVRGAAAELIGWRDQVLRQLRNQGVLVLDVEAAELTPKLINRYLEIKARHLL